MPITTIDQAGLSRPLGVGGIANPTYDLSVLRADGASGTLSLSGPTTTGGPSYIIMGNNDSAGVSGPNVIVSANRSLQFGVGTSFTAAGGGTFTPTLTMVNGQVLINRTSNAGSTTNIKLAVQGATYQGAVINGGLPFPGPAPQTLLNVISEFGVRTPVRIRVFGTENGGNCSHAEYLLISSTFDGVTFFVGLTQIGRINLNNNFGNMYLFLQGYGGAFSDTTQTMSGTAANCNLRINNLQNAYGAYSVTWEAWN
jgi:hypothetical protein